MPTTVDQLRADIETLRSTVRQLQAAYFQAIQGTSGGNLPGTSDLSSVDQEVTDLNTEVQQILSGSTGSNPNLPPSSNPPSSGPSTPTQPAPVGTDPTQAPPSSQPPAVDPNQQGQQGATQGTQVNLAPVGAAPSTPMTTPAGQASLTPSQGGQPAATNPSSADRVPVASA